MLAVLERYGYLPNATLGRITVNGHTFYTIERPWESNRRNLSCIPEGYYDCMRSESPRFGETFEILVPGRSHILFHAANYSHELEGCIALGLSAAQKEIAVYQSKVATSRFIEQFNGLHSFNLHICQYRPEFSDE